VNPTVTWHFQLDTYVGRGTAIITLKILCAAIQDVVTQAPGICAPDIMHEKKKIIVKSSQT
jgi:hypothetical protein